MELKIVRDAVLRAAPAPPYVVPWERIDELKKQHHSPASATLVGPYVPFWGRPEHHAETPSLQLVVSAAVIEESRSAGVEQLPPIDAFLVDVHADADITAQAAQAVAGAPLDDASPSGPPTVAETEDALSQWPASPEPDVAPESPGAWGEGGWAAFDWAGAAELGTSSGEQAVAAASWDATDWDETVRADRPAPSSQELVARALAQIAARVRAGELYVPIRPGATPEAAVAAALAAFLDARKE